jgi:hypothetical protein
MTVIMTITMDRSTTGIGEAMASSIFQTGGMASAATTETISVTKDRAVSMAFTPAVAALGLAVKARGLVVALGRVAPASRVAVAAALEEVVAEEGEGHRRG